MRLIVKFGGTAIKNPARIKKAANFIKRMVDAGNEVVAVVSAPGDTTNRLINLGSNFQKERSFSQEFLSLLYQGEEQSTILLTLALNAIGQPARAITLHCPEWPLISENLTAGPVFLSREKSNDIENIKIDERRTKKKFATEIEPLIKRGIVPVISGFFIRSRSGAIVSLGRGGSDITAFLVAAYLNGDEVLIVTDVAGVYTADPKTVANSLLLKEISADEITLLSIAGARVLHPNALRFKDKNTTSRIVNFKDLNKLQLKGTKIGGAAKTKIIAGPAKLMMVTLIGKNLSQKSILLPRLFTLTSAKGIAIHSMSQSDSFINLYLNEEAGKKIYPAIHDAFIRKEKLLTGISSIKPIAELIVRNYLFIESPGVIAVISQILSKNNINIIEMITSHTDVIIYVKSEMLSPAIELLKASLKIKDA